MCKSPRPNPKHSCFLLHSADEYFVFSARDGALLARHAFGEEIWLCEMFQASNILVLLFARDRREVVFWDDARRARVERLCLERPVLSLLVRLNNLAVALDSGRAEVFDLKTLARRACWALPPGCRLDAPAKREDLFGWSSPRAGCIALKELGGPAERELKLHNSPVRLWAFDRGGRYLASVAGGTVMRVHGLQGGEVRAFRLNYAAAAFLGLGFSPDSALIALVEEKRGAYVLRLADARSEALGGIAAVVRDRPLLQLGLVRPPRACFWNAWGELVLAAAGDALYFVAVDAARGTFRAVEARICLAAAGQKPPADAPVSPRQPQSPR